MKEDIREIRRGLGLPADGELEYGFDHRREFPGDAVRRYQAVFTSTAFSSTPILGDVAAARRLLRGEFARIVLEVQPTYSADAFDQLMKSRRFELVENDPAHQYKVWRLVYCAGDLERLAART